MAASERWYFTREQINQNPNRRIGLDADKELSYRQQAANFIQDMGQRLQVTQLCINTAIVYMHRFYMFHTFQRFPKNNIATCALFLAAKVEEQPRKLEHVIRCAQVCLKEKDVSQDTKSEAYNALAHEVVTNENIMLQTLGFDIAIDHPHTYVVKCCQLVGASKDLAQTSYFMATNSLHLTTMCLQYKPTVVACVCIYLASKWSNWKIQQSKEGREWFYYIDKSVTMKELDGITSEFLTILENSPSRLKRKLLMGSKSSNHHESSGDKRLRPEASSSTSTSHSSSGPSDAANEAPQKKPPMPGYSREKQPAAGMPPGSKPDHYHHSSMYRHSSKPPHPISTSMPNDMKPREVKPHNHMLKHKYPMPPANKEDYARKHMKDSNGHSQQEVKRPSHHDSSQQEVKRPSHHDSSQQEVKRHHDNSQQETKRPPHHDSRQQAYYEMAKQQQQHHLHSSGGHHSKLDLNKNHYVNNNKPPPPTKYPPKPSVPPPAPLEDIKPHNPPPQQRYLAENHVKIKVEETPEPPLFHPTHHSPPNIKEEYSSHLAHQKEEHNAFNVLSPIKDYNPPVPEKEEFHSLSNNVPPAPYMSNDLPEAIKEKYMGEGVFRKEKHKHKYSGGSIKMVLPIPKEKKQAPPPSYPGGETGYESSPKEGGGALKLKIPKNKITPPPEQNNSVTSTESLKIVIHRNQIKPSPSSGKTKSRKRDRSPSDYHHSSKRPDGEKPPKHSKSEKNSDSKKEHHHRSSQYADLVGRQSGGYPRSSVPPLPKDPPPTMPPPPLE